MVAFSWTMGSRFRYLDRIAEAAMDMAPILGLRPTATSTHPLQVLACPRQPKKSVPNPKVTLIVPESYP